MPPLRKKGIQGQILDRGLFKGDLARLSPISIVGQWHKKAAAKKCVRPIKSHNKSSLLKYNRLASWSICDIWNGEWFWHDTSKEGAYLLRFNVVAFLFIFHDNGYVGGFCFVPIEERCNIPFFYCVGFMWLLNGYCLQNCFNCQLFHNSMLSWGYWIKNGWLPNLPNWQRMKT